MEAGMPGEKSLRRVTPDEAGLAEAALAMAGGETIAYPTETQYGLGTDALNPFAVEALRELKGKGAGPVLALIAARPSVALLAAEFPPPAEAVARTCWPGPVTVLLPARDGIPGGLVGPEGLVGVRISSHPVAFRLTQLLGRPVVSTSANPAGQEPLHEPDRIAETFDGRLRILVDGGRLPPGPPSTLVDGRTLPLRVLREGAVSRNSLARRTHLAVEGGRPVPLALVVCTGNTCRSPLGEGVLKQLLRERGREEEMEVASAGVSAVTWGHAMEEAREAAWEEGIDLSRMGPGGRHHPGHGGEAPPAHRGDGPARFGPGPPGERAGRGVEGPAGPGAAAYRGPHRSLDTLLS
jgi:tRNA threonylcarbamoyl adenosine modification protein (Sua5/YciO/YrdC/YwlC family)